MEKGRKRDFISLAETFDSRMSLRRRLARRRSAGSENIEILSIPSGPIAPSEIARYWDNISLRKNETRVLELIRKVAPVEGISFVQRNPSRPDRSVIVKLENKEQPIPLKSMGEEIARIIQIALTLESDVGKKPSLSMEPLFKSSEPKSYLFIDELENGIHYSVLDSVWDFIFRVAESRGMQVFVTTHSWDCIESFQRISEKHEFSPGTLVNIQETKNYKKAICYTSEELKFISKNSIEVR